MENKFLVGNTVVTASYDTDMDMFVVEDSVGETWNATVEQVREEYTPISEGGKHQLEVARSRRNG